MIDKWLKAGLLEDGAISRTAEETPQGGVAAPRTQKITFSVRYRGSALLVDCRFHCGREWSAE